MKMMCNLQNYKIAPRNGTGQGARRFRLRFAARRRFRADVSMRPGGFRKGAWARRASSNDSRRARGRTHWSDRRQHAQFKAAGCLTNGPTISDGDRTQGLFFVTSRNVSDTRSPSADASRTPCFNPYLDIPLMTYILPALNCTSTEPSRPGNFVSLEHVLTRVK